MYAGKENTSRTNDKLLIFVMLGIFGFLEHLKDLYVYRNSGVVNTIKKIINKK